MEDISKYISDSVIKQLEDKGISRQEIEASIKRFIKEREDLGYEGDKLTASVKLRVMGAYKNILRSNLITVKGVVFGLGKPSDNNKRLFYMSKLYEGKDGYGPNLGYKVQEGFYPWGFQQGKPISDEPDYEQSGYIGIQYDKKLYLKMFKLTGDWVINKKANNAKSGDIIQFQLDPKNLDNGNIFINAYTIKNTLQEDKYKAFVEKELKKYNKDIKTIVDENYSGLVVLKGSVGDIEKLQNTSFRFDIVDDSVDWSEDYSLNTVMSEEDVNFIEGAMNVLFIGEVYPKKNEPGFGLRVYRTIVPEEFKKVELDKEMQEELSNNFDEELGNEDSDDDGDLEELL